MPTNDDHPEKSGFWIEFHIKAKIMFVNGQKTHALSTSSWLKLILIVHTDYFLWV